MQCGCCSWPLSPGWGSVYHISSLKVYSSTHPFQMAPCGRKSVLIPPLRSIEFHSTSLRADYLLLFIWIYEIIYFIHMKWLFILYFEFVTLLSFKYENLISQHSPFDMRISENTMEFFLETKLHRCFEILHIFSEETLFPFCSIQGCLDSEQSYR